MYSSYILKPTFRFFVNPHLDWAALLPLFSPSFPYYMHLHHLYWQHLGPSSMRRVLISGQPSYPKFLNIWLSVEFGMLTSAWKFTMSSSSDLLLPNSFSSQLSPVLSSMSFAIISSLTCIPKWACSHIRSLSSCFLAWIWLASFCSQKQPKWTSIPASSSRILWAVGTSCLDGWDFRFSH